MRNPFVLWLALAAWSIVVGCAPAALPSDPSGSSRVVVSEGFRRLARPLVRAEVQAGGGTFLTDDRGAVTLPSSQVVQEAAVRHPGYQPQTVKVDPGAEVLVALVPLVPMADSNDPWTPGAGWSLAWSDEFDRPGPSSARWTFQELEAGHFNNELERYTAEGDNAFVTNRGETADGALVIQALQTGASASPGAYTSARLITHGHYAFTYGKVAARIQVPSGQGIWPAFWMLGDNISEVGGPVNWPGSGEVDIMEKIGGGTNERTNYGTAHYANASGAYANQSKSILWPQPLSWDFHVYELEWTSTQLIWRLDGQTYHTMAQPATSPPDIFRKPFYLLLNVAVGGTWPGSPDAQTTFPQRMYVDWVRVYQNN